MTTINSFVSSLDARIAFEASKSTMSSSNLDKLKRMKNVFSNENVIKMLEASSVSTDFANRAIVSNARMNVYTIEKLANVMQYVSNASALNVMTRCIFESAAKLTDASLSLTREDAQNACSAHRKIADKAKKAHIVQNEKTVADSTVAAQHSSSLDALVALNVLNKRFDANNRECFTVNRDNEIAQKMLAKLAA